MMPALASGSDSSLAKASAGVCQPRVFRGRHVELFELPGPGFLGAVSGAGLLKECCLSPEPHQESISDVLESRSSWADIRRAFGYRFIAGFPRCWAPVVGVPNVLP